MVLQVEKNYTRESKQADARRAWKVNNILTNKNLLFRNVYFCYLRDFIAKLKFI